MSTKKNVIQTVKSWKELLKPCTTPIDELVVAGYGTELQVYNCKTGEFDKVICGQDIQTPKRTLGVLDTSSASCNAGLNPNDGLIYNTFQPGKRVSLDTITYTAIYTKANYLKLASLFGVLATYRVVATDIEQTFWAFNAILIEDMVTFPSGETDTGLIEIIVQPSGFIVYDRLNPLNEVNS